MMTFKMFREQLLEKKKIKLMSPQVRVFPTPETVDISSSGPQIQGSDQNRMGKTGITTI